MFTGIVEELGSVQAVERHAQGMRLDIRAILVVSDLKAGDSISVNGCCLTVLSCRANVLACDVVEETLNCTTIGQLQVGDRLNLERAVYYQTRMGGHLVQGHVDGVGRITDKKALSDGSWWITVTAPEALCRYVVHKGCIALDGVSLTIAELKGASFTCAIIPHTAQNTTLGIKSIGATINIEVDIMAKYVERLLSAYSKPHLS